MEKIKILHLEDSSSDAFLINKTLIKANICFDVKVVESRETFKHGLEEFSPDIILADHSLPSFNSYEALEVLQRSGKRIPFILITAAMSDEFAVDIIKRGADDYILKDRLERLPTAIENSLEKFRLERERQEFIDELVRNERRYYSLVENASDAIVIFDWEGKLQYVSSSVERVLGYTEKEALGQKLLDLIHPEDKEAAVEKVKSCLEKPGEPIGRKLVRVRHKNGSWRWIESTYTNMLHDPAIGGIVENFRDVTEHVASEQALKESEKKYRSFFENSMDGILLTSPDGEILAANPAACEIFAMSEEEICQAGRMGLVDISDPRLKAALETRERTGKVKTELTMLRKGGVPFPAEITTSLFEDAHGNSRTSMIVRDITEREAVLQKLKEKRTKLLAAQRMAKLGYWELNLVDNSLYWSDEVYRIWGRSKESFPTTFESFIETVHPDDRKRVSEELFSTKYARKNIDIEYRIVLPDGSIKWVYDIGHYSLNTKTGTPIYEGTVQDITERKMAMEQLAVSESRHRALVNSQTNYVIRVDIEGRYTYCNNKFVKDFGWMYPDNNLLGTDSMSSILDYHHERVVEVSMQCMAQPNEVFQVELDKPRKDGGVRTTLWDFICLTNEKGQPTEIQCAGIDISDRVKAEKALKESNSRYELVSKATSDAIWDWNFETDKLYWGEGVQTLFGYDPEKVLPDIDSWATYLHDSDRDKVMDQLTAAIEGSGSYWKSEYRFKKANSEYAYVIDRGFILRDKNQKALRMVGAMQDVTEKKKLEELLTKAYELARIGSYEMDLVNNTLYWSDITRQIHEVEDDFIPSFESGKKFYKEGASRNAIASAWNKALEQNKPFDEELQIVTARGNERWIRVTGEAEFIDGRCIRVYGSFQDIHKLKQAEIEVLQMLEEKESILESIGDAFFTVEPDWTVTYWNKEAEKLLSTPKNKVLGKNLWEVFPDARDTAFYTNYNKAICENKTQHFEAFYEKSSLWYEVNTYPSRHGLSVYFRDVTERKESDLQLLQLNKSLQDYTQELVSANKGLEQFSFIVSHNLRAPVANIMGLADLMINDDYSPDEQEQILKGLFDNVKRLDTVINDLNSILRVKQALSERKESVSLPSMLEDIRSSIDDLIQKEGVEIKADFSAENRFTTLKSYLHSIFYNLISNSIKYHRPGVPPVIEIKSERKDSSLIITFKDNGLGIDLAKKKNQVFGLYKRFHQNIEGKGMGLFMVKTQVEMLGGKIQIASEVDKGTEFRIEFKQDISENGDEPELSYNGSGR